jgi:hypothetical protein
MLKSKQYSSRLVMWNFVSTSQASAHVRCVTPLCVICKSFVKRAASEEFPSTMVYSFSELFDSVIADSGVLNPELQSSGVIAVEVIPCVTMALPRLGRKAGSCTSSLARKCLGDSTDLTALILSRCLANGQSRGRLAKGRFLLSIASPTPGKSAQCDLNHVLPTLPDVGVT